MQQAADDVDEVTRPNLVDARLTKTQTLLQGITYDRIFVDGSRHRIHPRTRFSVGQIVVNRITILREHGFK